MIRNLKLGTGGTSILSSAFINNEIKHLVIPDNFVEMTNSFGGNPIETINFGTGLTTIGNLSFSNNAAVCPEMITEKNCYKGQNFLKEVFIPKNVVEIGVEAFATVTSDVTIYIENPESAMTLGSNWSGFHTPTVIFDYKNVTSE